MAEPIPFRPFRAFFYTLFFAVVTVFCLLFFSSLWSSVRRMAPKRLKPVEKQQTAAWCAQEANRLFEGLESQRKNLVSQGDVASSDQQWTKFRAEWVHELRSSEALCDVDAKEREKVKLVFRQLDKMMDAYSIHAVQFAAEVGATVDSTRTALNRLMNEVSSQ